MNTALSPANAPKSVIDWNQALVVVGAGVAGFRLIEEFRRQNQQTPVILIGNEPYLPYDRVKLSQLLAGTEGPESLALPLETLANSDNFQYICTEIVEINPDYHHIIDAEGQVYRYQKLVLATGSRPHIPDIEGVDLSGVFTFRSMRDSEQLKARTTRCKRLVVVGGGLLGIEAARALQQGNTEVILIQQANRLMDRQLDTQAASALQQALESQGIQVITSQGVRKIEGQQRVEAVILRDGTRLSCDTVLLSAGIRPNMEIARKAWLKVGRGIRVNDQLQTSHPDIYAIGECAEHNEQIYGLAAPGLEQATVAADHLCGGDSQYLGSHSVAKLKLVDIPVFSMGDVDEDNGQATRTLCYRKGHGLYRKLFLRKGKVIGAIAIGEWADTPRLQELITHQRSILLWQMLRFRLTGLLWSPSDAQNPHQWPETAIICNCNHVSRGTLTAALEQGCCSVTELSAVTRAGTTCGSCKPLLQMMTGAEEKLQPEYGWRGLLATGLLTTLVSLLLWLVPGLSVSDSVQGGFKLEQIWNNGLIKQITGFSLLGLTLIGLLMSFRKRVKWLQLGSFGGWRLVHVSLGTLAIALLAAHTGFHNGSHLNQWLLINFLALAILGSLAGLIIAMQYRLSPSIGKRLRNFGFWAHLLLSWPLPALLSFHILSVYYF